MDAGSGIGTGSRVTHGDRQQPDFGSSFFGSFFK
jgi:hypothetical protein